MTDSTTPIGLCLLLALGVLLLVLPRRYALLPILAMVCYMPTGQAIMVGPLHFYILRLLVIFGWLRMLFRRELQWHGLTGIDKAFLAWAASGLILGSLLWGDLTGIINRLGYAYDVVGAYVMVRALLRSQEDIARVFKQLSVLVPGVSAAIVFEKFTGKNPFFIMGGVAEFDEVRDGVIRSQAVFGHSILAGMFGAALLPYFVALWCFGGRSRWLAACGVVASTVIVLSSGSSGPVGAYGAAILGLLMWRFRYRMRAVRWGIVAILVGLQLVMKAPVWWAISHISIFSGNTAFYRANLIDKFITHFSNWWLLGTRNTLGWGQADGDYVGQGVFRGADITNMFVRVGVDGGLLTLILFVLGIVLCFRGVGTSLRSAAFARESRSRQFAIWALGVALFTNVVAFFDVQYFDQNIVMWCLLLAMISCITKLLSRIPQSAEISDEVSNTVGEFQPQSAARGSAVW